MTATAHWRSRMVFISSTFRDMNAARDHLRYHIFPILFYFRKAMPYDQMPAHQRTVS